MNCRFNSVIGVGEENELFVGHPVTGPI